MAGRSLFSASKDEHDYSRRMFDVALIHQVVCLAIQLVGDPWFGAQRVSQIVDVCGHRLVRYVDGALQLSEMICG
jgi:hypothetical protein